MPAPAASIWLPGRGVTDIQERRVDAAVKEYDETLRFGRNEETGQHCIFMIKKGHAPLPVLGFNEIPHPDDAVRKLWKSDAMRHGKEILDTMNAENEEVHSERRRAADEANGIAAEGFEWLMRDQGQTPYSKSYDISHKKTRMGGYS